MELQEGDVVLCTVDRIIGTVVFVRIDETGQEGSIVTSEIAPGRIRNLRDYVVPKKRIVCKVLRITSNGNIELSLRRVTQKETKEVLQQFNKEKKLESILKSILGDKTKEVIEKIKLQNSLIDFLENAKNNPKELEKITEKKDAEKILEILNQEKEKKQILKKEFSLKTTEPNGILLIKKILNQKDADIRYISAGKYSIKVEDENIKKADTKLKEILNKIQEQSKKNNIEFELKEKK